MRVLLVGMMMRTWVSGAVILGMTGLAGCGRHAGGATAPTVNSSTSHPATAPSAEIIAAGLQTYLNKKAGVQFQYPADWVEQKNKEYTFFLVPAGAPNGATFISLDVPNIPIHIPGMVTMNRVEKGYLDDMKKEWQDVRVLEERKLSLPNSDAKRIRSTWTAAGRDFTQDVVLIIHNDNVYLLKIEGPSDQYPRLQPIFDEIISSLTWVK